MSSPPFPPLRKLLLQPRTIALLLTLWSATADAQWTYGASGTTSELRGLSVASRNVVWASGARGMVVRSTDGGRTWRADSIVGATHLDLRAIHAFDGRNALTASAGEAQKGLAKMFLTSDAGRAWRQVYDTNREGVFLDAVAFWNQHAGIALSDPVDGRFFVLTTSNGGRTWTRVAPERLPPVLRGEAAFAASGTCLVTSGQRHVWIGTGGGGIARVFHSADRGRTWSVANAPVHAEGEASGIFSLAFFDARRGIAVGGDYTKPRLAAQSVAITRDGGATWRPARESPAAYLSGVSFAGALRNVVAVGLAGTFVSRDSGETWSQIDSIPLNSVRSVGRAVVAVGPRGRVARMDLPR